MVYPLKFLDVWPLRILRANPSAPLNHSDRYEVATVEGLGGEAKCPTALVGLCRRRSGPLQGDDISRNLQQSSRSARVRRRLEISLRNSMREVRPSGSR